MCVYEFIKQRRVLTTCDLDSGHGDASASSVPSNQLVVQGQMQSDDTELSSNPASGDNQMDVDMEVEDVACDSSIEQCVEHSEQDTPGLARPFSAPHASGDCEEDV